MVKGQSSKTKWAKNKATYKREGTRRGRVERGDGVRVTHVFGIGWGEGWGEVGGWG